MDQRSEQALRTRAGALPLEWIESARGGFAGEAKEDFLEVITAAHVVAEEAKLGLHRWIDAGRRAGASWSDIGATLGISRQAAQQRFGSSIDETEAGGGDIEVRLGANAFNEMRILEEEGRQGRELVGTGALSLYFRQTPSRWEYRRLVGLTAQKDIAGLEREGWRHVSSWFPFHYLKRPVDREA